MKNVKLYEANLNIRYDLPDEVWHKVSLIYQRMPGWLGFGKEGIPYWYGYENDSKTISASVELSGLHIIGKLSEEEWANWLSLFKSMASERLGFKVGEIEAGEVDF